jgi:DNA polymerase-1
MIRVVQRVVDLPDLSAARDLFVDFETTSFDSKTPAFHPYKGHRIAGIAVTVDDEPDAWYVPLRHATHYESLFAQPSNIDDVSGALRWLGDTLTGTGKRWINHNNKFDAHFAHCEGVSFDAQLIDTVQLARVVDKQRKREGYDLKKLSTDWLGVPHDEADEVAWFLRKHRSKDYGDLPIGLASRYAATDVWRNRDLWHEIQRRRYDGDERVWDIETRLTDVLFDMERLGVRLDVRGLEAATEAAHAAMAKCESIVARCGFGGVNLDSTDELHDALVVRRGLPVVGLTLEGDPSFDKHALRKYLELGEVRNDSKLRRMFQALQVYRSRSQFVSLYGEGWLPHVAPDGYLHPSYNANVRTGRMSCRAPNMTQLSKEAKAYILPDEGDWLMSRDYSQVEYRVIAALTEEPAILDAYLADPTTDFHSLVADLCNIDRRPAKTVNFGLGFGMGERRLIATLAAQIGGANAEREASYVFNEYHRRFPRIKLTSDAAEAQATRRAGKRDGAFGYVRTMYGRRRDLQYARFRKRYRKGQPKNECRKAFNTSVQGTAADMLKEALLNLHADPVLREAGLTLRLAIHDDIVSNGPRAAVTDPALQARFERIMCTPRMVDFPVPLLADGGESPVCWADAG